MSTGMMVRVEMMMMIGNRDGDEYRGDNDKREEKDEVGEAEGC